MVEARHLASRGFVVGKGRICFKAQAATSRACLFKAVALRATVVPRAPPLRFGREILLQKRPEELKVLLTRRIHIRKPDDAPKMPESSRLIRGTCSRVGVVSEATAIQRKSSLGPP